MTFSIGIRTIGRVQNYLRYTLSRLVESGTLENSQVLGLHVNHGEGIAPNTNGAFAILNACRDESDWILFLEDDVDIIDDLIGSTQRWLDRFANDNVLFYPLSCFYSVSMNDCRTKHVWHYPIEKYYGSQGLVMRRSHAMEFAYWLIGQVKDDDPRSQVSFDLHLSRWHKYMLPHQDYILTPAPCFLDHIGEFSSIGPPGSWERVGKVESFEGRSYSYHG